MPETTTERPGCSCDGDPIECSHEAAREQAEARQNRLRLQLEAHEMGWAEIESRLRREAKFAREQEAATADFSEVDPGPTATAYGQHAAFCERILADLFDKPQPEQQRAEQAVTS